MTESTDADFAQKRRRHRWIAIGVVGGLIVLAGGAWWLATHSSATNVQTGGGPGGPGGPGGQGGGGGRTRIATTVGVAAAELGDMPVFIEALGTVTPTATATVRPQVAGTISQVLFNEGQQVKAGEVLAVIDPRAFENARMEAEGNLKRDQADLASNRITLERYQKLLTQDSIAGQDVDSQEATVKKLEGTVMADQASLKAAELNLSYSKITAPMSGRVGLRQVDVGNYVAAGDTTGIAVITVMDPIDVQFSVPQDQIPAIQKKLSNYQTTLPAIALDRSRSNTLADGMFSTLDNRVDTTTGTVKAKARFPNKDGVLFPNQFVNVRVQLDTLKDCVTVPAGAVRKGANGDFAYVLDRASSTVSMRNVKTGQSYADRIAILDGLKVGEEVITEGGDRLKDGATVQLPSGQPQAAKPGENKGARQGKRRRQQQGMDSQA